MANDLHKCLLSRTKDKIEYENVRKQLNIIFSLNIEQALKNKHYKEYMTEINKIQLKYNLLTLQKFDDFVENNQEIRIKYNNLMVDLGIALCRDI